MKKSEDKSLIDNMVDALVAIGGEGSAQVLGSEAAAVAINGVISTQCPSLDAAIGRGGIPLGRLTVMHGPEMSGKTTMALHMVAETQRLGGIVIYIDKEYKLDPDYAKKLGVKVDDLIVSQPSYLERVYELIDGAIALATQWRKKSKKQVPVLVVLDSINACITKAQLNGSYEDRHIAPQPRVHSENLPRIIPKISKENVALLFIAQERVKIGKMFGDPNEVSGGNAVKYYASLILKVRNIGAVKSGEAKVAQKTRVECVKNQISPPFRRAEFEIRHGVGIDQLSSLLDSAIELGIITFGKTKQGKVSKWLSYKDKKFAAGRQGAWEALQEDTELMLEILGEVNKKIGR